MHRIDGPGATVDNKFTEGDPTGGVQATVVTAPWLNEIQENIMAVLTAAAIAPVKGNYGQLLASLNALHGKGRLLNIQVITATGTYTKTPGTNKIRVVGTGVGGGGGGCEPTSASQSASGGGGSAGAFGEGFYDATNITTLPVTIGTPGVGANGLPGTNGTSSSFGSLLTFPGGLGGNLGLAQSSFSNAGGNGANPSSAPTGANIFGSPGDGGGTGGAYQTSSATGGVGGKSPFGSTSLLSAVKGFGCGGSGARSTANASANNGFNGDPAIFIVEEYS